MHDVVMRNADLMLEVLESGGESSFDHMCYETHPTKDSRNRKHHVMMYGF